MQPSDDDVAGQLFARAADDIALVRASLDIDAIADTIVGFHAQQTAEKLLGAVPANNRIEFRSHTTSNGSWSSSRQAVSEVRPTQTRWRRSRRGRSSSSGL